MFLAVPFGMLSDKYWRKVFLVLDMLSFALREGWVYLVCKFNSQSSCIKQLQRFNQLELVWQDFVSSVDSGGFKIYYTRFPRCQLILSS